MNDKLSLQDLADILSHRAQIDKKDAEVFFKEFFQLILDRIYENDSVKVKDFGTFKLTAINSRESVDVNTGEKIEIPAHYRFTFLPDKTLKEIVNVPYAKYQTVLLEDGMDPSDVNFELLAETDNDDQEDDFEDNEVSKIVQEQAKLIEQIKVKDSLNKSRFTIQTNILNTPYVDIDPALEEGKGTDKDHVFKPKVKPFVYTYSSTSNVDESQKDVIMMTVRKDKIAKVVEDTPYFDNEIMSHRAASQLSKLNNKSTNREIDPIANNRTTDYKKEETLYSDDLDDEMIDISTTFNILPDHSDSEFDAIDVFQNPSTDFDTNDQEIDDEQTRNQRYKQVLTEQGLDNLQIDDDYLSNWSSQPSWDNDTLTSDPNRPLFPEDDDTQDNDTKYSSLNTASNTVREATRNTAPPKKSSAEIDQVDIDAFFADSMSRDMADQAYKNTAPTDRGTDDGGYTTRRDFNSTADSDVPKTTLIEDDGDDLDDPFLDYENNKVDRSNFRNYIQVSLLVLAIIIFIGYNVYKLLDFSDPKVQALDKKVGHWTMTDSFPTLYDNSEADSITNVSEKVAASIAAVDSPVTEAHESSLIDSNDLSLDETLAILQQNDPNDEGESHTISDNLTIDIVNKGAYYVHNVQKHNYDSLFDDQIDREKSLNQQVLVTDDLQPSSDDVVVELVKGMTLRSLASKYYGNGDYWVYIYRANRSKLGSPNALTIGIKLVIPQLSELGISNAKDPDQIERARRLEREILG